MIEFAIFWIAIGLVILIGLLGKDGPEAVKTDWRLYRWEIFIIYGRNVIWWPETLYLIWRDEE